MNMRRTLVRTSAAIALAGATVMVPAIANANTLVYFGPVNNKHAYWDVEGKQWVFTMKFLGDIIDTCPK